jgi:hypothetical protein
MAQPSANAHPRRSKNTLLSILSASQLCKWRFSTRLISQGYAIFEKFKEKKLNYFSKFRKFSPLVKVATFLQAANSPYTSAAYRLTVTAAPL